MAFSRVLLFLLILTIPFGYGCRKWSSNHKRKQNAREIERNRREKEAEAQAKYEEAIRRQAQIQSPKTRRAMKKQYKRADRYNNHKKEFFLKRWFTPKKKRTAPVNPV